MTEKEIGRSLEVHHIKRFADFDSYRDANALSNLICLCRDCHMSVEYKDLEWQPNLNVRNSGGR